MSFGRGALFSIEQAGAFFQSLDALHEPRKPDSAASPRLPVLDYVSDNLKANAAEQRRLFVGVQAGVVERVAAIRADFFAIGWTGVKHQYGRCRGMLGKHVEHPALVIWC